jgi:HlyD family secretion protein
MSTSHKRRKAVIFSLIGLGLAGLLGWSFVAKNEAVTSVQTAKVERRDLIEIVVANGRIEPDTQVKISPEVSGEIVELPLKEGDSVHKGDLLVRIKPQQYEASRDSAKASYESALAGLATAQAQLARAEAEFHRNQGLYERNLISESVFIDVKTAYDVEIARARQSEHAVTNAKAALERAEEDLLKTAIFSPLDGTITRLNSRLGERVHGTAMMAGTDIMTIADLNEINALVDIGEMDIVLLEIGQKAHVEVDAFRDQKFTGSVSEIANSAKGTGGQTSQEATRFEVRIRINEKENFRPGMSVTAEIETRYRTNALAVPIGCVTSRVLPPKQEAGDQHSATNEPATNSEARWPASKDKPDKPKPTEVVWVVQDDKVHAAPVKLGISDEDHWEITEGLEEGQEIVIGSYRAINKDLEEGRRISRTGGNQDTPDADDPGGDASR